MRSTRLTHAAAALLGAALVTSCSDGIVTGPEPAPRPQLVTILADRCEVINFNSFTHGALVNTVSVFGTTLTVSAVAYTDIFATPVVASTPRAYNTANVGGDTDLEFSGPGARCPGCNGLGMLLVTQEPGGAIPLDAAAGGELTLSGFGASASDFYINSFTAVDNDVQELGFKLFVDGALAATATPLGDGSVQTVNVSSSPTITNTIRFVLGTATVGDALGSGAIDNIEVCIREDLGDEGCTPGYWKNHEDSWGPTGFTTGQTVVSVFSEASGFPSLASNTLLQALQAGGGPGTLGAAQILLRAAVAALLNAAHPDVDYPRTAADIIADVNAALDSNNREDMLELASELDADNNRGCPIN